MTLAYFITFITFSTYGTWLPGGEKGSSDREHNVYGTPWLPADPARERRAREAMAQPAYTMGPDEREIVCRALVELAAERRWSLLAAHVRSNHVHLVVHGDCEPGRMMSDFKARCSRELTRAGFDNAERRRWTRHGSTRHLFREDEINAAIRYTLDEQGSRMACYAAESRKEPRTK